jgi:large subunit ribosomal protein L17
MRHRRTGKKLGRDSAHRKALYSNLAGQLIEHGRIKTTVTKAKAVKPIAEQMITLGRRGDLHARRQAVAFLRSKEVVHKLFDEIGPRFADRPGGYSRIVRIGPRPGDAAEMVYLELLDEPHVPRERPAAGSEPAAAEPEAAQVDEADDADEAEEAEGAEDAEPEAEAGAAVDGEAEEDAEAEPAAGAETAEPEAAAEDASEEPAFEDAAGEDDAEPETGATPPATQS